MFLNYSFCAICLLSYLCKEFYRNPQETGRKLMQDISRYTEPVRPGRRDPHNIRTKSFVGFIYRVAA